MISDRPRRYFAVETERHKEPGGLADVPFNGMHPERAVGDMGHAEILSAGQEILEAHGDHCAQRNLKRPAAEIEIACPADSGMEINPIAADTHRVVEELRAVTPEDIRNAARKYMTNIRWAYVGNPARVTPARLLRF